MNVPLPLLTAYFDGSCALCAAEMKEICAMDRAGEVLAIDCAAPGFDATGLGVSQAALLGSMHVRDVLGDWHRGVDAIALLYATVGAPWLARAWAHPLTRPFTRRLYPWLVRHRHRLSALGLHLVAPRALRLFARRHGTHAPVYCRHDGKHVACGRTPQA